MKKKTDILKKLECFNTSGNTLQEEEPWQKDSSLVVKSTLTNQITPFLFLCENKDLDISIVEKTILSNQAAILCALASISKETSHLTEAYYHIGNQLSGRSVKSLPKRDTHKSSDSDRDTFKDYVEDIQENLVQDKQEKLVDEYLILKEANAGSSVSEAKKVSNVDDGK